MEGDAAEGFPIQPGFPGGQAADEMFGEEFRLEILQKGPDLIHQGPADRVLGGDLLDDHAAGFRAGGKGFCKQILDEEDFHPVGQHDLCKVLVFQLGPFHPQHVIEEEFIVVGGGEPFEAQVGPVDDDFPELACFRVHAEICHFLLL